MDIKYMEFTEIILYSIFFCQNEVQPSSYESSQLILASQLSHYANHRITKVHWHEILFQKLFGFKNPFKMFHFSRFSFQQKQHAISNYNALW